MPTRSEQDVVSRRGVALTLGGHDRVIPRLPIGPARAWKELLAASLGEQWARVGAQPDWADIVGMVAGLTDLQVELLLAYDEGRDATGKATRPGILGGREWIEANADDEEVYEGFKAIVTAAFPFVRDLARTPALVSTLLAQLPASSTSSPLPSGESGQSASNRS